jgi:hypothetical protein
MGQGLTAPSFNDVIFLAGVSLILGVDMNDLAVVSVVPPPSPSPALALGMRGWGPLGSRARWVGDDGMIAGREEVFWPRRPETEGRGGRDVRACVARGSKLVTG